MCVCITTVHSHVNIASTQYMGAVSQTHFIQCSNQFLVFSVILHYICCYFTTLKVLYNQNCHQCC